MKGLYKLALLTTVVTVLVACQFTGEANATCSLPQSYTATSSITLTQAAQITLIPSTGCTFYLDSVSTSLYAGSAATARTVTIGSSNTNTCTSFQSTSSVFPLGVTLKFGEDTHYQNFDFQGQGLPVVGALAPSGAGAYFCVQFSGWGTGEQDYITLTWHTN